MTFAAAPRASSAARASALDRCGDDRPVDEQKELSREGVGLRDALLPGKVCQVLVELPLVRGHDLRRRRVTPAQLAVRVDERAAAERRRLEPLAKRLEHGEEPTAATALDRACEPAHPLVVAAAKPRGDELVFRAKVIVERHLRDARLGSDTVDADAPHAVAVEELRGRVEDLLRQVDFLSFRHDGRRIRV